MLCHTDLTVTEQRHKSWEIHLLNDPKTSNIHRSAELQVRLSHLYILNNPFISLPTILLYYPVHAYRKYLIIVVSCYFKNPLFFVPLPGFYAICVGKVVSHRNSAAILFFIFTFTKRRLGCYCLKPILILSVIIICMPYMLLHIHILGFAVLVGLMFFSRNLFPATLKSSTPHAVSPLT